MEMGENTKKTGRARRVLFLVLLLLCSAGLFLLMPHTTDRLIFGTWCKDCEKDCTLLYELTADGVSIDDPSFFYPDLVRWGSYEFVGAYPDRRILEQYFDLNLRSVPGWLFFWPGFDKPEEGKKTKCGMYLRVEKWGIERDFWINPESPPSSLNELVEGLLYADRQICGQANRACVYQERAFSLE